MRSLGAVGSTNHSMIKFPTSQGIMMMETSKEALWECKQWDRMQSTMKEAQWRQREEQIQGRMMRKMGKRFSGESKQL
ncbi:hypothetical protein Tco_1004275 [Tanacetum coccineum]|uniref:Uncharacterized protein n=1 Tax=Tanacetum coccineum TaxID=301880 RepID=A0ABQ5FDS0_9ASTR